MMSAETLGLQGHGFENSQSSFQASPSGIPYTDLLFDPPQEGKNLNNFSLI